MSLIDELYREGRDYDAAIVEEYEYLLGNPDRTPEQELRMAELSREVCRIIPETPQKKSRLAENLHIVGDALDVSGCIPPCEGWNNGPPSCSYCCAKVALKEIIQELKKKGDL